MNNIVCLDTVQNNNGVVTHYKILSSDNSTSSIPVEKMLRMLRDSNVFCCNLIINGNKIDYDPMDIRNAAVFQGRNLDQFLHKLKVLNRFKGVLSTQFIYNNALYIEKDGNILLKKVYIKSGEYELPYFVTGLYKVDPDEESAGEIPEIFEFAVEIKLKNKSNLTGLQRLFRRSPLLEVVDLRECDMSKINNTRFMFTDCKNLSTVKLDGIDTSNLINMEYMFNKCQNLVNVSLSSLDLSKVETMTGAFAFTKIESADLRGLCKNHRGDKGVYLDSLFSYCYRLKNVIMPKEKINVSTIKMMFNNCKSLKSIELNNLNVSGVLYFNGMFSSCASLEEIDISSWNTRLAFTFESMFRCCTKLRKVNFGNIDTHELCSIKGMFSLCTRLVEVDLSKQDLSKVNCVKQAFNDCNSLRVLKASTEFINKIKADEPGVISRLDKLCEV